MCICRWSENCVSGLVCYVACSVSDGVAAVTSGVVYLCCGLAAGSVGDPSLSIKVLIINEIDELLPFVSGMSLLCSHMRRWPLKETVHLRKIRIFLISFK